VADDATNPLAQVLGRLGLSSDQLSSLQSQLGRVMPSEQMKLMRDLVDTFSPSGDQLSAIRRQLEAQRVQVEAMLVQLEDIESTVDRLATTAEQLRAMQEPFQRLTHLFSPGQDRGERDQ
jgi:archaellum component FlaC